MACSIEVVGCDPDSNPEAKSGHQRAEDDSMDDFRSLPPDLRYAPLASALLTIESEDYHKTPG
jgi:hypothetical protein